MSRTLPRLYFTEEEVAEIARPILSRRFEGVGFEDVEVVADVDWDGEPILRVKANVASPVSARDEIDAMSAVRSALIELGDERVVFFDARAPEERQLLRQASVRR